jgi:hypothetical protein
MAVDPRKTFMISNKACPGRSGQEAKKKTFLDGLRNIGDLEILNQIGASKVGEGLRVLAGVSDTVRTGVSVVPGREGTPLFNSTLGSITGTAIDAVDAGATAVLSATGLGRAAIETAASINPSTANKAYGAAKQVFQRVKRGNFKVSDIPSAFEDLQDLETLMRGIFPGGKSPATREKTLCGASPYAMDLISHAPKSKFMFIVQFDFHPEYRDWARIGNGLAFVVKESARPNVEFEYEEVNMYNHWTKVAKRTVYPPMNMKFYDDETNNANFFYTAYLRSMSPVANMKSDNQMHLTNNYETHSMDFASEVHNTFGGREAPATKQYAASLGPLQGDAKTILSAIRLFHIFDYGRQLTAYNFYNPKITSFELDDLTMQDTGAGSEFGFNFAYDSLYVEPNYNLEDAQAKYKLDEMTAGGLYPINPTYSQTGQGVNSTSDRASSSQNADNAPVDHKSGLGSSLKSYLPEV